MKECVDSSVGRMLHAYEVQTLTDDERSLLEQHLLVCDACHDLARAFLPAAIEIRQNEDLIRAASRAAASNGNKRGRKSLLELIWPKAPLLLKPAVSYGLLGIVVIVSLWSTEPGIPDPEIVKPLQSISIAPLRESRHPMIRISDGSDALLQFYVPGGDDTKLYSIEILEENGSPVYDNQEFLLSAENRGLFYLNLRSLEPGDYTLNISVKSADTSVVTYHFSIVE